MSQLPSNHCLHGCRLLDIRLRPGAKPTAKQSNSQARPALLTFIYPGFDRDLFQQMGRNPTKPSQPTKRRSAGADVPRQACELAGGEVQKGNLTEKAGANTIPRVCDKRKEGKITGGKERDGGSGVTGFPGNCPFTGHRTVWLGSNLKTKRALPPTC